MLNKFSLFPSLCQSNAFRTNGLRLFYVNNVLEMPKKQNKSAKQTQKTSSVQQQENAEAVSSLKNGNISIKILAKPGAKQNSITDIGVEGVGVQIAAPPVDGEANTELVKYISKLLGLRKSDVSLDKGSRSRNKTLVVTASDVTKEDILSKFQREIEWQ